MKTYYELWDTADSNLVGSFPTSEAALAIVRYSVKKFGKESMASVALGCENETGRLVPIALGDELIDLAFQKRDLNVRDKSIRTLNATAGAIRARCSFVPEARRSRKKLTLT